MATRLAEIAITLMLAFILVPAGIYYARHNSDYIDKFSNAFLLLSLTVFAWSSAFKFKDMSLLIKYVAIWGGGWTLSAFGYEIFYFLTPESKMPSLTDMQLFSKHLFYFTIGVLSMMGYSHIKLNYLKHE